MSKRLPLLSRMVLIATAGFFLALASVQLISFGAPLGETAALDMRLTGYTAAEASAFLKAIEEEGRQAYFGLYRTLDSVFPPLLAMSLIILFRSMRQVCSGVWIAIFALLPMAYLAADLVENSFLSDLDQQDGFEQLVRYASDATIIKYIALALSLAGVILAALRPYSSED